MCIADIVSIEESIFCNSVLIISNEDRSSSYKLNHFFEFFFIIMFMHCHEECFFFQA